MESVNSILDNVVYLYIQTTELSKSNYIFYGVKVSNGIMTEIELEIVEEGNKEIRKWFEFAANFKTIVHNIEMISELNKETSIKVSEILNLKELAAILEPWRSGFDIEVLVNQITT